MGPFYDGSNGEFRFVDIWQQKLHILDLSDDPSCLKTKHTTESVGYVAISFELTGYPLVFSS